MAKLKQEFKISSEIDWQKTYLSGFECFLEYHVNLCAKKRYFNEHMIDHTIEPSPMVTRLMKVWNRRQHDQGAWQEQRPRIGDRVRLLH